MTHMPYVCALFENEEWRTKYNFRMYVFLYKTNRELNYTITHDCEHHRSPKDVSDKFA